MALHICSSVSAFLSIGKSAATGMTVLAASTTNAHKVKPLASLPLDDLINAVSNPELVLLVIIGHILAMILARDLAPGSSILISCSGKDEFFAEALLR